MKHLGLIALFLAGLLYVSLCTFLFFAQRSLLYFPTPEASLPDSASISLRTAGETLRIWSRPADGPDAIIYFGGNAEDVSSNFGAFAKALPRHAIYLVNYRGYGGSTGSPSEGALFADALAVYDLVHQNHPNISLVGRSLGSGVAAYLASTRKVERLVLVTPYDSIENVAKKRFPIFPISLLLKDKFNSSARVPSIGAKTLVILAENDEIIPRESSDALIAEFPSDQVIVKVIHEATHNSVGSSPVYAELIGGFCERG